MKRKRYSDENCLGMLRLVADDLGGGFWPLACGWCVTPCSMEAAHRLALNEVILSSMMPSQTGALA